MAREKFVEALDSVPEVELTTTGRSTGRSITHPVWLVRDGHTLWLLPVKGSQSEWFKNVERNPTMRLAAGGEEWTGTVRPAHDPSTVHEVVDRFRAKYGADEVKKYYSNFDAAVAVPL